MTTHTFDGDHLAARHLTNARARTRQQSDFMADVENLPDSQPRVIGLAGVLAGDLTLTLKTKSGDSVELSTRIITVLGVLLFACASCAFYLIYTTATVATSQRYEAEIRARDSAELKRDNAELRALMRDYQAQVVSGFTTTQAYISAHSSKVQFMTGLLTKDQQRAVNEYDRTHPTPIPPDPNSFKWKPDNNQLE